MSISIQEIRKLCTDETIVMTNHVLNRCIERNITYDDIKNAINNGQIIENYPEDYPHPSCLIVGISLSQQYLHVVVGLTDTHLWIITAYYPDKDRWCNNMTIRKEGNEQ